LFFHNVFSLVLKAEVFAASFGFGLVPHLFISSSCALHVECHREVTQRKEGEKEEEEPEACGHVVWIDHCLV